MAGSTVLEVALDVRVTVKLEAENVTEAELARLVERDPESVRGAILALLDTSAMFGEREAGWLDEDRCAYATEVVSAEAIYGDGVRAGRVEVVR